MTQPPSSELAEAETCSSPSFTSPVPWLTADMDEEEAALTMGLGLLVRAAAAVEYMLHAFLVHLDEEARAYAYNAGDTGNQLAGGCIRSLEGGKGSTIPDRPRAAIISELKLCKERFGDRNRFVHGYLIHDDESQQWLTLKGSRQKGARAPEIEFTSSTELWELTVEFHRLRHELLGWDTTYFGEPGDPSKGEPEYVSVKR
ncbi:hypothetical protein ACFWU3_34095 [Streptomyces sp. NPDC058685]|uniref:hypothetical protein n=1 Tax=Streptomyces sp. NPDC058685 TaxID=3346598 RepID=UPI003662A430